MHGTSLLHTFADPAAEEHHTQLTPERPGRTALGESQGTAGAVFWQEAQKYKVLPMLGMSAFFGVLPPLPTQTTYAYHRTCRTSRPA